MITIRKNGFYQVEDHAHVACLGIESDRLPECTMGIKALNAKGVFCSPYHRFSSTDMSFLQGLQDVEAVLMRDTTLRDIDDLYTLKQLKYFRCNNRRPPIDFTRLNSLETLVLEPTSRDAGLASLDNLQTLHVWNYTPSTRNFEHLPMPASIRELELNWVSFTQLANLPTLPQLSRLTINHCKNLTDLNIDLDRFPRLSYLKTKACVKIPESEVERARRFYAGKLSYLSLEEAEQEHPH